MPVTIDGTNGITNGGGYTGDGVSFADATPANTLVTTTGGNVGIGTSNLAHRLTVQGPVDNAWSPNIFNTRLTGTSSATSGSAGSGISFTGYYTGTTTLADLAFVSGIKENTVDGNYAGALVFGTRTNGSGIGSMERMRVISDGNVAIGQTAAYASTIGNVRLSVAGGIAYNVSTGPAGYGLYNGGATAEWFMGQRSSSDHSYKICTVVGTSVFERFIISAGGIITAPGVYSTAVTPSRVVYTDTAGNLGYNSSILAAKTNVADLIDTDWLAALRPITFNYRKLDEDRNYTDEAEADLEYGLIAEEVEGVNTELVFYDETENGLELRGVHYNKLIVPLLAEVQKLRAELTDTKARLAAVEGAIA